jgi:hypothetical protein
LASPALAFTGEARVESAYDVADSSEENRVIVFIVFLANLFKLYPVDFFAFFNWSLSKTLPVSSLEE